MPFVKTDFLEYFVLESFTQLGIPHGFFTRQGGCSPKPWSSLNLATSVGDTKENVLENRRRILEVLRRPLNSIYDTWQIHGTNIVVTENARSITTPHVKADGIITKNQNVTLMMLFADCVPVILFDPRKKIIGIAHAGWKGTLDRIAEKLVWKMETTFGSDPKEIWAVIGPSIGPDHYEVGENVSQQVKTKLGVIANHSLTEINHRYHFDLWSANERILKETGILRIEIAHECTACNIEKWFSHRAEGGSTGRFAGVVSLPAE